MIASFSKANKVRSRLTSSLGEAGVTIAFQETRLAIEGAAFIFLGCPSFWEVITPEELISTFKQKFISGVEAELFPRRVCELLAMKRSPKPLSKASARKIFENRLKLDFNFSYALGVIYMGEGREIKRENIFSGR